MLIGTARQSLQIKTLYAFCTFSCQLASLTGFLFKGLDPRSDPVRRYDQLYGKPVKWTNKIKGYAISSVRSTGVPWQMIGSRDWVRTWIEALKRCAGEGKRWIVKYLGVHQAFTMHTPGMHQANRHCPDRARFVFDSVEASNFINGTQAQNGINESKNSSCPCLLDVLFLPLSHAVRMSRPLDAVPGGGDAGT